MESLSRYLSPSPPFKTLTKTLNSTPKSQFFFTNHIPISNSTAPSKTPNHIISKTPNFHKEISFLDFHQLLSKPQFTSSLVLGLSLPLSCLASETTVTPAEDVSGRINLESILVSIDNFFNRYPFFVATVAFIWLVVIPLTEEYLQKYKYISAINAFKKLKDDPNSQLLDIREKKSLASLGSPNLRILNKTAVQVDFREGDEDGFVKRVLENFGEPANTTVCVIDNFDGNSMKVAELLVKNGFKEAYAVRGGIRGQKGWQEIQESLLPLSVHVYPKEKSSVTKQLNTNGGVQQQDRSSNELSSNTSSTAENSRKHEADSRDLSSITPPIQAKGGSRPSSPYPNYPDYKPPSSPTPSKPN